MKYSCLVALMGETLARHHHHNHMFADTMESLESQSTSRLVANLGQTLQSALAAEARDDKASAVAKTAAIKNIQKALTARILKRLDDGQPLVEVARKMKAIEGMQPQINDMERRLGIMQSVEPVLENAIKTLQKVVDVRGMGKASLLMTTEENEGDMDVNKDGKPIAPSWHVPVDQVKNWKNAGKDRPLTYNEREKLTREDEDAYNSKKIDMHPPPQGHYDTDPVTVANKKEAEDAAAEGQAAIRKGEIDAINIAKQANDDAKKEEKKGEESKESKKAEKEAKEQEKKDMEKKETEDKKVEADPPAEEEKKDALMQINGWQADESDSDSDDE